MANVTMKIDDELLKKVRKIAVEKGTSLTGLVRGYLSTVAERDEIQREKAIHKLRHLFSANSTDIGGKNWTREELHER